MTTTEQVAFMALRMHERTPLWMQALTALRGRAKAYWLGHECLSMTVA